MAEMLTPFGLVVATAATVASSSSRNDKVVAISNLLTTITPGEAPVVVGLLTGEIRQGRIGVGWASIRDLSESGASDGPALVTVGEVDDVMTSIESINGSGSKARRAEVLEALFARSSEAEVSFVKTVLSGGLRQGALDGVMATAIGKAAGVPVASVRRAAMFSGDLGQTAEIALTEGRVGLDAVGLRIGRGIQPMLASTSASATEALAELSGADVVPVSVQEKLDGIRLQVHRSGDDVWLFTRNLNDITDRLPAVCALARSLPADSFVLDGEVIGEQTQFFDILHLDGTDLVDLSLDVRLGHLATLTGDYMIGGIRTADADEAESFLADVLAAGHEGVMIKALDSLYAAGRRGKTWRKVKPVHTYDLVVLGAEWGHGRRTGWLSNLHLGARLDSDSDEFAMVGKTFKGLTDDLLKWQTAELLDREVRREGITVFTRPELVVEIALDGVFRSTTYPGGLALRFARVKQYRPDKSPTEADTIADLAALIR